MGIFFFIPGNQRVLFLIKSPVFQLEKERVTQEMHFMNVDFATCMPAGHGWFMRLLSSHCQVQAQRVAEIISPWAGHGGRMVQPSIQ